MEQQDRVFSEKQEEFIRKIVMEEISEFMAGLKETLNETIPKTMKESIDEGLPIAVKKYLDSFIKDQELLKKVEDEFM